LEDRVKPTTAAAWLCLALACLALGTRAEAQQGVFAGITGTVKDSSGAALTGASLTVTNLATNVTHTWTTNVAGVYSATGLVPGPHRVEASFPEFKTQSSSPFSST
jgi:hypothetical protein